MNELPGILLSFGSVDLQYITTSGQFIDRQVLVAVARICRMHQASVHIKDAYLHFGERKIAG